MCILYCTGFKTKVITVNNAVHIVMFTLYHYATFVFLFKGNGFDKLSVYNKTLLAGKTLTPCEIVSIITNLTILYLIDIIR